MCVCVCVGVGGCVCVCVCSLHCGERRAWSSEIKTFSPVKGFGVELLLSEETSEQINSVSSFVVLSDETYVG